MRTSWRCTLPRLETGKAAWRCPWSCPAPRLQRILQQPSSFCPPLPSPPARSSLEPPLLPLGRSGEEQEVRAPGGNPSPGPPPAPMSRHVIAGTPCHFYSTICGMDSALRRVHTHLCKYRAIFPGVYKGFYNCSLTFKYLSYFQFLLLQSCGSD